MQEPSEVTRKTLPPFQRHSQNSREAAISMYETAPTKRAIVWRYIRDQGERGATDEEMQIALRMPPHTQVPRRIELERDCLIISGGNRKTTAGRNAAVWRIKNPKAEQLELGL